MSYSCSRLEWWNGNDIPRELNCFITKIEEQLFYLAKKTTSYLTLFVLSFVKDIIYQMSVITSELTHVFFLIFKSIPIYEYNTINRKINLEVCYTCNKRDICELMLEQIVLHSSEAGLRMMQRSEALIVGC